MKIKLDDGIYQLAETVSVSMAYRRALEYAARYHFEPVRPDLIPAEDDVTYTGLTLHTKRSEMRDGVAATVDVRFRCVGLWPSRGARAERSQASVSRGQPA
jgi:hypothetical protein